MQVITEMIEATPFIHAYTQIDAGGYREISNHLKFKSISEGQNVQIYGDTEKRIYILLNGSVNIFGKNDMIMDWEWAIDVYNALRQWKTNVFDKKVRMNMRQQFEQKKIQFELQLN